MRSVISMKPLSLTRLRPPDELKPILKPPTDFYELERIPVSSRKVFRWHPLRQTALAGYMMRRGLRPEVSPLPPVCLRVTAGGSNLR